MDFALLGDDSRVLPLARAILASGRHRLRATVFAPRCHAELVRLHPGLRSRSTWEELLSEEPLDAVIVSGDDGRVLAAARQLPALGRSLVVLPAPGQTLSLVYELTLIQAEAAVRLVPLFPLRTHPAVRRLNALIESGALGNLHHVQLHRRIAPTGSSALIDSDKTSATARNPGESSSPQPVLSGPLTSLLTADMLADCFLFDVDLLRSLCGNYDQVTALRSGDASGGTSLSTVTIAGTGSPQAVLSAMADAAPDATAGALSAGGDPRLRLHVAGSLGSATLSGDPDLGDLALATTVRDEIAEAAGAESDLPADSAGTLLLASIEELLTGRGTSPDWTDLTRAFELLDATERSVRRRRTIDLHYEVPSERSVFKTQMTAIGCGLLMFTLVAMVGYLVVAALFDLNIAIKHVARVLIFLPLGIFLLLQLLLFLTHSPKGEG